MRAGFRHETIQQSSELMNVYPALARPVLTMRSAVVVRTVALTLQPNLFHCKEGRLSDNI